MKGFIFIGITFASIVLSQNAYSQCIDSDKVTYGGDFDFVKYIHLCPTYTFAYEGDTSHNWNVLNNPIDINQAPAAVLRVKESVEQQIKGFADESFYSKLVFNSVEVVYPEMLQAFTDSGRQNLTLKNCMAKYFFYYAFLLDTIASYHIGIAVDKRGNIISKFDFPSKNDYKPIDSSYTYCDLMKIARRVQPAIDPVKEISLEYDRTSRRFYWLITQDLLNASEGVNYLNQVMIDASDVRKTKTVKAKVYVQF